MNKTELQVYVNEEFGMDLCDFIRHKVQNESFYDHELASVLNTSTTSIRKLRNTFGIKKANGFSRRFERLHGRGSLETFKSMIKNPGYSRIFIY